MSKKRHKKKNTSISTAKKNITPSVDKENFSQIRSYYFKNFLKATNLWTSLASVGAFIIIIWNILKYLYVLIDSLSLQSIVHVPLYLLMSRKNLRFTDLELAFSTFILFLIIFTYTSYNPMAFFLKKGKENGHPFLPALLLVIILTALIIFAYLLVIPDFPFAVKQVVSSILSLSFLGLVAYRKYFSQNFKLTQNQIIHAILCSLELIVIVFILFLLLPECPYNPSLLFSSTPGEIMIDQNNNVIVADLGDQYIIQDATLDIINHQINIDTSHYSRINNAGEIVSTKYFSAKDIHLSEASLSSLNSRSASLKRSMNH